MGVPWAPIRLVALLAPMIAAAAEQPARRGAVFTNGSWYDGTTFVKRTAYIRDGFLAFAPAADWVPSGAETLDIAGGYVVPPFCEAHNHNIAVGRPEERNTKYLSAGVFYVQILNDAPQLAAAEADFWSRPGTVDVAFAHAAVTGPGGHPIELLEGIKRGGGYPSGTELADHAYFEVATAEDLDRKWSGIVGLSPSIVKLFLQFSEEHEKRRDDPAFYGNRGLAPDVFRHAVELAHRDRRRVAAHVVSASDFHVAVDAGVDVIAHLPRYMTPETLAPADAAAAADKHIVVITTASLARGLGRSAPGGTDAVRAAQVRNLQLLKRAGVTFAVGSDSWSDTSHGEVQYLRSLDVFTDRELFQIWTENCARTVFPQRRIARLEAGYEADFVVLDDDPFVDFAATRRIKMRVKRGQVLAP